MMTSSDKIINNGLFCLFLIVLIFIIVLLAELIRVAFKDKNDQFK